MKRVVVLGAGFAGLTIATELEPLAAAGKASVTLVERNPSFQMGFAMQWFLVSRRTPEEGARPYAALKTQHAKLIHDEVVAIDTRERAVFLRSARLDYDFLAVAMGAELAPELVPGLTEGAYNLYDMQGVRQFKSALARLAGGTVVIAVTAIPFKCPPAPYEYAMLVDDLLQERGIRNRVQLFMLSPEPQPMPVAGKAVGEAVAAMLAERDINYQPNRKIHAVDPRRRVITFEGGSELSYNLLGAVPPHRAPQAVRESGLADASGFVPADVWTMKTAFESVFAVGDVASFKLPDGRPHPKAGVFAVEQARAAAGAIAAAIEGGAPGSYSGRGVCFVDAGRGLAAPAEAELLAPGGPRFQIAPPSEEGLESKRRFEREHLARWFGE